MESTLYIGANAQNIAPNVILSGDPRRVESIIRLLEDVQKVSVSREFHTYTGLYKGIPVTVSSTGIGGPSAAIALEELFEAGARCVVRLGTVMSLNGGLRHYYVPKAAVRRDGTSDYYVEQGYPAVASPLLAMCMKESIDAHHRECDDGIVYSTQGYYTEMKESKLSKNLQTDVLSTFEALKRYGVVGMDMETATILTLANLMGIDGCSVMLATVSENVVDKMSLEERQSEEIELARIVLDGLVNYVSRGKQDDELDI